MSVSKEALSEFADVNIGPPEWCSVDWVAAMHRWLDAMPDRDVEQWCRLRHDRRCCLASYEARLRRANGTPDPIDPVSIWGLKRLTLSGTEI